MSQRAYERVRRVEVPGMWVVRMRGALPDSRRAITGDLTVLREYSCGCIVYLDAAKQEIHEKGIFCGHNSWPRHRSALLRGQETQQSLFAG